MAEEHMNDTWDAATVQASGTNLKRVVDDYADLAHTKARADQAFHESLQALFLEQQQRWNGLALQSAQNLTALSQRQANLPVTWDQLVIGGEVDTTAQGAMANNLANQMRSIAFEAVQSALAQAAQTSAPAQGTTGVAQGAMQTGAGIADVALLAQIAKLAEAVNVLYIKVLGEEVTAEEPAV